MRAGFTRLAARWKAAGFGSVQCAAARRVGVACAFGVALGLTANLASAGSMDPATERLQCGDADPACGDPGDPDEAAFTRLVNAYGFALAPEAFHSARTTGFGGFQLGFEGLYTKIDSDADYIRKGTRGATDQSTQTGATENKDPASLLQLYSVRMHKGFGFGLEVAGQFGFMPQTSIMSGGADVRLSLLEGFRDGLPGVLPDFAVGGGVRTITGTSQFQLTVAGADAQISKPLTINSSSVLTPWVGFQYLWIFGDGNLVDLSPNVDAQGACNFQGVNSPGNPVDPEAGKDADGNPIRDGQPVCDGGSSEDFNRNEVFEPVRIERQRFVVGMSYRYEMIYGAGQFMMDFIPPDKAQVGDDGDEDEVALKDVPKQWSFVVELGAAF